MDTYGGRRSSFERCRSCPGGTAPSWADQYHHLTAELGSRDLRCCWAEVVAGALAASPDRLDTILDDACAGAPWRRQLGVAEPSASLASTLEDLAGMVVSGAPNGEAVLAEVDDGPRGGGKSDLVRAVLRSKLGQSGPGDGG
jgi:hypothetical protein